MCKAKLLAVFSSRLNGAIEVLGMLPAQRLLPHMDQIYVYCTVDGQLVFTFKVLLLSSNEFYAFTHFRNESDGGWVSTNDSLGETSSPLEKLEESLIDGVKKSSRKQAKKRGRPPGSGKKKVPIPEQDYEDSGVVQSEKRQNDSTGEVDNNDQKPNEDSGSVVNSEQRQNDSTDEVDNNDNSRADQQPDEDSGSVVNSEQRQNDSTDEVDNNDNSRADQQPDEDSGSVVNSEQRQNDSTDEVDNNDNSRADQQPDEDSGSVVNSEQRQNDSTDEVDNNDNSRADQQPDEDSGSVVNF